TQLKCSTSTVPSTSIFLELSSAFCSPGTVPRFLLLCWHFHSVPFCVAFDGETSSSGFCLGLLTRLRSVTENAILRFDDAFRGLVPHGGAAHVLSHAPHHFGFFLALTGTPLKGFQCVQ